MNLEEFKHQISSSNSFDRQRVIDDPLLCYAYGTDASLYRMVPKLVLIVENSEEVILILKLANQFKVKITFRAAGTSLSGQAVTDGVLVKLSLNSWNNYTIYDHGNKIRLEPGVIGAHANQLLKPYYRKIGPDPASIDSCKVGGIVANNSSGMCCGVSNNTYHTFTSMKIIFVDGSYLDTGDELSCNSFKLLHVDLLKQILAIKQQICASAELSNFIRHKFRIKNTSGYSLNSFLDYDDPLDIISHLLVGSEGTLGFIAEVTYNTVREYKHKQLSLVFFEDTTTVANLAVELSSYAINAMELLDISSLLSICHLDKAKPYLPELLQQHTAAILIEIVGADAQLLQDSVKVVQDIIERYQVYHQIPFTNDSIITEAIWNLRKGIIPTIGANRASGSSVIIEDVAVDIPDLPELISRLHSLFAKYGYTNGAILGHVLAGNIHFVFTPKLDDAIEIDKYNQFMHEMSNIVIKEFAGSLKAEHGCGRNVAPFVSLEWGNKLYDIMWQIKYLFDPEHILNPDVILTKNSALHMANLKDMPSVLADIDKCIECGFCERVCPSKKLSLTPRQRIATYRYIQKLKQNKDPQLNEYIKQYKYYGIDTCATTGLCALSCPVGIDTGKFILQLKAKSHQWWLQQLNHHYAWFISLNRYLIKAANSIGVFLGISRLHAFSSKLHKIIPLVPVYLPLQSSIGNVQQHLSVSNSNSVDGINRPSVIYISSCSNKIFDKDNKLINSIILQTGYQILIVPNENDLCCGQFFASSGCADIAKQKVQDLLEGIKKTGCNTVIMDNSSCYYSLLANANLEGLKLYGMVDFIWHNLDKLNLRQKYSKIALHIDCSSKKLQHDNKILAIVNRCAKQVVIPYDIYCCGFAGSKGFTLPELNQAALSGLEAQIAECELGVTFNRSCQIGLSFYGKKPYVSLPELINDCLDL